MTFVVSKWFRFNLISVLPFEAFSEAALLHFLVLLLCVFLPRWTVSQPSSSPSSFTSWMTQPPICPGKLFELKLESWPGLASVVFTALFTLDDVPLTLSAHDWTGAELFDVWLSDCGVWGMAWGLKSRVRTGLVEPLSRDDCKTFALENSVFPGEDFLTSQARDVGLWRQKIKINKLRILLKEGCPVRSKKYHTCWSK